MESRGNVMEPMRLKLKDFCGVGRTDIEGDRVVEALEQIIDTSLSEAREKEKALKDKQKLVAEEQHKVCMRDGTPGDVEIEYSLVEKAHPMFEPSFRWSFSLRSRQTT